MSGETRSYDMELVKHQLDVAFEALSKAVIELDLHAMKPIDNTAEDKLQRSFDGLPWKDARTKGQIVFSNKVPSWVRDFPEITTPAGLVHDGYRYCLFGSGILWRIKV